MLAFLIFICLLIILYFLSLSLLKNLNWILYFLVRKQSLAIQILSLLFLPGVVIHEVSHMLIAELLGVKSFRFSFIPKVVDENKIKAGSLEIQKTDPFRRTLIGLAPILFGLGIISFLSQILLKPLSQNFNLTDIVSNQNIFLVFGLLYLIFIISNTMFSSDKDLETALLPILVFFIIGLIILILKIKVQFPLLLINFTNQLLAILSIGLGITIIIDCLFWLIIKLFRALLERTKFIP